MNSSTVEIDSEEDEEELPILEKILHDQFPELKVQCPTLYDTYISTQLSESWLEKSLEWIKDEGYVEDAIEILSKPGLSDKEYVVYDIAIPGLYDSKYIDLLFRVKRHLNDSIFGIKSVYIGDILTHEPLDVSRRLSQYDKKRQTTTKETIHVRLYGMSL